jgi:hypothetical protein
MKKIMLVAVAFVGMCFASCGNKANGNAEAVDSTVVDSIEVVDSLAGDSIIATDSLVAE